MSDTPDNPSSYNPSRLPLRVRVSARGEMGDGTSIVATGWRILEPDEPEYDQVYQEAARAYRTYGWPMPYAGESSSPTRMKWTRDGTRQAKGPCTPRHTTLFHLLNSMHRRCAWGSALCTPCTGAFGDDHTCKPSSSATCRAIVSAPGASPSTITPLGVGS